MKFGNPYWSNKTRIELLQKWIIVHSIIYYELNTNIISDSMFDANSKQLVELIKSDQEACRASKWYKVFKGFDGSSGFDLYSKLSREKQKELMGLATHLIDMKQRGWK
jgi:hypothetical protein